MSFQTGTSDFWKTVIDKLQSQLDCVLLLVVDSDGSSPGRAGFKMLVSSDDSLFGSIGGGLLEHDLAEAAKEKIRHKDERINYKKYYHDADEEENKSGLICSGSQDVATIPLSSKHTGVLNNIFKAISYNKHGIINISFDGIDFVEGEFSGPEISFMYNSETDWHYAEKTGTLNNLHIFGGGHCGLALSKIMKDLGFYVIVYDNREGIATMNNNIFANEKKIISYDKIGNEITESEKEYVTIMTFGHMADELVLKQLLRKKIKYLGMMGSASKVNQIYMNLFRAGFTKDDIEKVHSPIGVSINSKTPEEIAISIAAEIIKIKNQ